MANHHPERCQECGVKKQLYDHVTRFVCKSCLVALRIELGWVEARARAANKRREKALYTADYLKNGPTGVKPGPKPRTSPESGT